MIAMAIINVMIILFLLRTESNAPHHHWKIKYQKHLAKSMSLNVMSRTFLSIFLRSKPTSTSAVTFYLGRFLIIRHEDWPVTLAYTL